VFPVESPHPAMMVTAAKSLRLNMPARYQGHKRPPRGGVCVGR
jgi:hypothetical protein